MLSFPVLLAHEITSITEETKSIKVQKYLKMNNIQSSSCLKAWLTKLKNWTLTFLRDFIAMLYNEHVSKQM